MFCQAGPEFPLSYRAQKAKNQETDLLNSWEAVAKKKNPFSKKSQRSQGESQSHQLPPAG